MRSDQDSEDLIALISLLGFEDLPPSFKNVLLRKIIQILDLELDNKTQADLELFLNPPRILRKHRERIVIRD